MTSIETGMASLAIPVDDRQVMPTMRAAGMGLDEPSDYPDARVER
jgi:hypothetical protein